ITEDEASTSRAGHRTAGWERPAPLRGTADEAARMGRIDSALVANGSYARNSATCAARERSASERPRGRGGDVRRFLALAATAAIAVLVGALAAPAIGLGAADLKVTMTGNPTTTAPLGGDVTYSVLVENIGDAPANSVTLSDSQSPS